MDTSKKIILVPDTSWLMEIGKYDYNIIKKILLNNLNIEFWIHNEVLNELDGLKKNEKKGHIARKVLKYIYDNDFRVYINNFQIDQPDKKFLTAIASKTDAIVLSLAAKAKEKYKTMLLTTDTTQIILAKQNNIEIMQNYKNENIIKTNNNDSIGSLIFIMLGIGGMFVKPILFIWLLLIGLIMLMSEPSEKEKLYNDNKNFSDIEYDYFDDFYELNNPLSSSIPYRCPVNTKILYDK